MTNIIQYPDERRIDVNIGSELFTSFHYNQDAEKPVLYPIVSPSGKKITRHHLADPMAGERVDHPHHIGMWLNYGDVNGIDFWNNSAEKAMKNPAKYGWIKVTGEPMVQNDRLIYRAQWQTHDGEVLLHEVTTMIFRQTDPTRREIIRTTQLIAAQNISLDDNKEGFLGLRLTRALEHPSDKAVLLSKSDGAPQAKPVIENTGVSGRYHSPEGISGPEVWGTRASWMTLSGKVGQDDVNITIYDHPDNPGYPTYWHARAYGLFAANPLGQSIFSKGAESLNLKLKQGESITFHYMVGIEDSPTIDQSTLKERSINFAENF